ncbi:MAG: hypothetical protein LBU77_01040 [Clostridiales bacterium]|jgi:hypothetical protein|nr:hypothetical protein [Clostridiales bacterium]
MKLVYIASPYHADTPEEMARNKQAALDACEEAYRIGRLTGQQILPITPLVNFPYLNESKPKDRAEALRLGLSLLEKSDELWCAGDHVSDGMKGEIQAAVRMEKPVFSMGMAQEKIQVAIADMRPMLDEKCCFKGSNQKNYADQFLLLSPSVLAPWALEPENQLWRVTGHGFGNSPTARGQAVYVKNLFDGEKARFNRGDFIGIVNPNRLPNWAKEALLQEQNSNESEDIEYEP